MFHASQNGANRVFAAVAHGLFLKNSLQKLKDSPIEKVLVTNSIDHKFDLDENQKIEVVSIAPLLAKAIQHIHTGQEMSELFI